MRPIGYPETMRPTLLILVLAILAIPACDSRSFREGLDDTRDKINGH